MRILQPPSVATSDEVLFRLQSQHHSINLYSQRFDKRDLNLDSYLTMAQSSDFTIPGSLGSIGDACSFIVSGAEQAGFSIDELFRIELACDEACTNIIEHAYGGDDVGVIRISWRIDDSSFTITMNDDGPPFDPDEVPPPEIPADPDNLNGLKTGGLGIYFMRNLMDEVRFSRDEHTGNILVMVKYRSSNENK